MNYEITIYIPERGCEWLREMHVQLFSHIAVSHPEVAVMFAQIPGSIPQELPSCHISINGENAKNVAGAAFDTLLDQVADYLQRTRYGLPWRIERIDWDDTDVSFSEELETGFEISISTGSGGGVFTLRDYWYEHAAPDWDVMAAIYRAENPDDIEFEREMA